MKSTSKNATLPTPFFKDRSYWAVWIRDAAGKRKPQWLAAGTEEERELARAGGKPVVTHEVLTELARAWGVLSLKTTASPTTEATVASVVEVYLASDHVPTLANARKIRTILRDFAQSFGTLTISELKTNHFNSWLRQHESWSSPRTVNSVVKFVKACFSWCVNEDLISFNPAEKVKLRSEEKLDRHMITDAEEAAIMAKGSASFAAYFRFLLTTGCRPSEAIGLDCDMAKEVHGGIVFDLAKHKTSKKGKSRRIYCTGEAATIVRAAMADRASGPVFLGPGGQRMNLTSAQRMVREIDQIPATLTLYSCRHTYITRFLEAGGTIEVCAELVGNSPAILHRHYNHLSQKGAYLMAQAAMAAKPVTEPTIIPMTRAV